MTKINAIIFAAVIGIATVSQAMIAPWYRQVRQFDAAVEAVAERFEVDDADELLVSSVQEMADDSFVVTTDKATCSVEIVSKVLVSHNGKPMPIVGAPQLSGKVIKCASNKSVSATKSYEKISAKMDKAAAKGNFIIAVGVNAKGTIKLTYKTDDN